VLSVATTSTLVCFVQLFIRYVAVCCLCVYVCVCVCVCVCVPDVLVYGMSGCEINFSVLNVNVGVCWKRVHELVLNGISITTCTVRK
jgi:hypothetical protein